MKRTPILAVVMLCSTLVAAEPARELIVDHTINEIWSSSGIPSVTFAPSTSKIVLQIAPDGVITRNGIRLEELTHDDLVLVVRELIDVIRKR